MWFNMNSNTTSEPLNHWQRNKWRTTATICSKKPKWKKCLALPHNWIPCSTDVMFVCLTVTLFPFEQKYQNVHKSTHVFQRHNCDILIYQTSIAPTDPLPLICAIPDTKPPCYKPSVTKPPINPRQLGTDTAPISVVTHAEVVANIPFSPKC